MTGRHPRLVERRLTQQPGMTPEQLSVDPAHTQAKLAAKKATIRALEAKVRRLETVLRAGGTWADYQAGETVRAEARHIAREGTR